MDRDESALRVRTRAGSWTSAVSLSLSSARRGRAFAPPTALGGCPPFSYPYPDFSSRHESGDGGSRTRSSSLQARRSATRATSPGDADGWIRTTTARGSAITARGAHQCSASATRVTDRTRTGTARLTTSGARRYTTATTKRSGDDRTRTGDLSPDKRALCSSELRPRHQ